MLETLVALFNADEEPSRAIYPPPLKAISVENRKLLKSKMEETE